MPLLDPNALLNLTASILTVAAAVIPFLKKSESRRRNCGNLASPKKSKKQSIWNPLWNRRFEKKEDILLTSQQELVVHTAALLHDMGHAPFLKNSDA